MIKYIDERGQRKSKICNTWKWVGEQCT